VTDPNHNPGDTIILGIIALGVILLCGAAIWNDKAAEASAWTAVLMAIISAIKERQSQRSIDRMGASLANSPPATPAAAPNAETEQQP